MLYDYGRTSANLHSLTCSYARAALSFNKETVVNAAEQIL